MESAAEYTQRLVKYGARAHKSLGQNFLISDEVIESIVLASTLQQDVPLVEIGPGLGVLTRALAKRVPKMWAVELDNHKIGILNKELKEYPIEIVHQDALKLDLKDLWGD
ncbi:MAG: ribosomal RNA small subunit methyltransferase A, partial [Desulfosporosinus sp.]|nr:ribosomal RNA small subunit methyltransferase A [Desulfosporosinus sp.]